MDTIRINKKDVSMKSRTYKIGRGSGNDILCSDIEVSNEHAELIDNNGTFTLIDYSRNGTFVNGNRIHNTSCHVNYGDSIVFAGKERLDWSLVSPRRMGTAPASYGGLGLVEEQKNAPYSVASMVCGIASLVLSVSTIVALALAIIGLALGVSGTRKIHGQEHLYKGMGMLKAGKVCSIISLCINGIVLVVLLIVGAVGLSLLSGL